MATIYDVAKAAGVSPKTVSRVLNGDAPVGQKTREAVQEAMRALGYVPSNAARMMRSNQSGLIGLITGALSQNLEPNLPMGLPDLYILQGFQQIIADSTKTLLIADTGGKPQRVPQLIQTFLEHRVEALVYVADRHLEVDLDTGAATCPLVLVNCFDAAGTTCILPDDAGGQRKLVADTIAAGHRRIAYLGLDPKTPAAHLRRAGYRAALAEAGIDHDPALEQAIAEDTGQDPLDVLSAAFATIWQQTPRPSAICCGNDEMALRLYQIIREQGLSVPQDVSITGFDNYRAIAETLYPPLTTVELPYHAMGRRAAEKVLSLLGTAPVETAAKLLVDGPVIWRESVARRSETHQPDTNIRRSA